LLATAAQCACVSHSTLSHTRAHMLQLWGWLVTVLAASQWVSAQSTFSAACQCWGRSINQKLIADSHLVKVTYVVIAQDCCNVCCDHAVWFTSLHVNDAVHTEAIKLVWIVETHRWTQCGFCAELLRDILVQPTENRRFGLFFLWYSRSGLNLRHSCVCDCLKAECWRGISVSLTAAAQWCWTVQRAGPAQIGHKGALNQLKVWLTYQSRSKLWK